MWNWKAYDCVKDSKAPTGALKPFYVFQQTILCSKKCNTPKNLPRLFYRLTSLKFYTIVVRVRQGRPLKKEVGTLLMLTAWQP